MEKTEVLEKLTAIGTCEDDATRRDLITSLCDEIETDYDKFASTMEANETLTTENERLTQNNMQLFLRVSEQRSDAERKKEQTGIDEQETKKRSFDDCFDEKGRLK